MKTLTTDDHKERARVLGRNLRRARKNAGRSQLDVCAACNITQGTYSKYESGKVIPSALQLVDLANATFSLVNNLLDGV